MLEKLRLGPVPTPNRFRPKWVRAERIYHMDMKELLPKLIQVHGMEKTAELLEVSLKTITFWAREVGARSVKLYLMPGEEVVVRKQGDGEPVDGPQPVM